MVYAATHRNGMRGAVKILRRELSGDDEARSRFLREGYVANRVDHPGIVRLHAPLLVPAPAPQHDQATNVQRCPAQQERRDVVRYGNQDRQFQYQWDQPNDD